MKHEARIVCIGEILWDALPGGLYLGGAPLNVCYHLNRMGLKSNICSKIGDDRLGKEALRKIAHKEIPVEHIQQGGREETGFVKVAVSSDGEPSYDFIEPAAWDFIALTPSLRTFVQNSWGMVYGTLAQRNEQSRHTIRQLLDSDIRKILDLNLRPPYADPGNVEYSLRKADIIKMNEDELFQLKEWFALPGTDTAQLMEGIASQYKVPLICVTRGARGAVLLQGGRCYDHPAYQAKAKDSVGAGDAFLAAMIQGIQHQREGRELLKYANAAGSLVAQRDGAMPEYNIGELQAIVDAGNH